MTKILTNKVATRVTWYLFNAQSNAAFQNISFLNAALLFGLLWFCRTSHVVNDSPLSHWGATYWYVAIGVNFFLIFKFVTTVLYLETF